jgi:streptomycin 6-kinase
VDAPEWAFRVDRVARARRLVVERVLETDSSVLAFVCRDGQSLVFKLAKRQGDEWKAGDVLAAFNGRGAVRVYEHGEGATLMERATPGHSLAAMAVNGADDEATAILAATIETMTPGALLNGVPTVEDWGWGFDRYVASRSTQIPSALLSKAQSLYRQLCRSQRSVRLLHGDLHHDNVLFDQERGWLAIDPKGVVGEVEYETGAALRNPVEHPELFADPVVIQRRVDRFCDALGLRTDRVLAWAFAQAVLSAVWAIEDDTAKPTVHSSLHLAEALVRKIDHVLEY